ncbi:MAG: ABC transporter substrate-binding protein [Firmicutes bacterium]|nr:ABC transporter substrate-binding protein [Bacillota bacterium]
MIKKLSTIILILLIVATSLLALLACNGGSDSTIKVVVPDGAPAFAVAKLLRDSKTINGLNVNYEIVTSPDTLQAKVLNADIAIVPTNLASIVNKGAGAKLVAVNTFGNLYLVGRAQKEAFELKDIEGESVYSVGRNAVPDFTFQHIIKEKGLKNVDLRYVSAPTEVIPRLKSGDIKFAVLGEPSASLAVGQGVEILMSLSDLWAEVSGEGKLYPQASLIASNAFLKRAESHEFLNAFFALLEENASWIISNPSESALAVKAHGSLISANAVTADMLLRCNINPMRASTPQTKDSIDSYLKILFQFNPNSIGGSMVDINQLVLDF